MKTICVNIQREPVRYDIKMGKGIVTQRGLPKGFVITDTEIYRLYPHLRPNQGMRFILPDGEDSKTRENYNRIIDKLNESDYSGKIIALGGGVVGDLAGFVASTYKRGIPLIQIPTTLLAMVDSSIGGKNGTNLGKKKNQLGTIYQPDEILTDADFLKTLPENEFNNGVAEIIKYGMVFDSQLLKRAERKISAGDSDLEEIIEKCCKIKARVVEIDEQGKNGYRNTLNFGHTIGHAIEIPYGFSHGQAIAIGMIYALRVSDKSGIPSKDKINQVAKALKANSLPTELPVGADIERIIELMKADKKGPLVFVFGSQNWNAQVNEDIVREVLSS